MVRNNRLHDFQGTLLHETDDAYLIQVYTTEETKLWFPKSITQDNSDGTFTCPEWLAQEKELI